MNGEPDVPVPNRHAARRPSCPGCGASIGSQHLEGCDVARCVSTGGQFFVCGGQVHEYRGRSYGEHDGSCEPDRWTGLWPGTAEAIEYGWYARFSPGSGWQQTTADDPEGAPDLNRVAVSCHWDPQQQRYVRS